MSKGTRPNHIVITTINDPVVLETLRENLASYDRLDDVTCWVIADKITPESAKERCNVNRQQGFDCRYIDIGQQDKWGRRVHDLYKDIPYCNESRRNVGFLMALEEDCERLITIDDDNFPTQEDFIAGHQITGSKVEAVDEEPDGWHNVCESLVFERSGLVFPRGFPLRGRNRRNQPVRRNDPGARIGVTAGMWLQDPDVDATAWINGVSSVIGCKIDEQVVLANNTWTPVNTQNTSVARELIPAYCCIPMGHRVPGGEIERYGDIWGGYILQAIMNGSSYRLSYGAPLVEHRRNPHDYVDDLRHEFWGMLLTDWILFYLKSYTGQENSIIARVESLGRHIANEVVDELPTWAPTEISTFVEKCGTFLQKWARACSVLAPDLRRID